MAEEELNWTKLPPNLRFIIAPAEKYGRIQFGEQIDDFQKNASDEEKNELRELAHRLWEERDAQDGHAPVDWVTSLSLVEHPEAARVEFLMVLMTELGYS